MSRDIGAIETEYDGIVYRSRTEARWAVFFDCLGLEFEYETEYFDLSAGQRYLPDFYIHDFNVYFEVKPSNEDIVTEECIKARCLAYDLEDSEVWLAMGAPSSQHPNILQLSLWDFETDIEEILEADENRYQILEDRRDSQVYWLHSEYIEGNFHHSYMVGGPGESTDHERLPLLHNTVLGAYEEASSVAFDED